MPTACILQSQAQVHLKSRRLEVTRANPETGKQETLRSIPLHDLDRVIFCEDVQITSQAMCEMLREEIPISILSWNNRYLGGFLPAGPAHGNIRLSQYRRTLDTKFTLNAAKVWVEAKIYNQRRVLQRLDAARRQRGKTGDGSEGGTTDETARITVEELGRYFRAIDRSDTVDEVRGYEGAATAKYFRAWATFLPDDVKFERRSKRPPLNAVNACISFASTVLYHESVAILHAHGLDPALGTLHTTDDRRWSLALDLIEPFRPAIGEALTLDLFSRSILKLSDHFERRDGGVFLNQLGKRKFLLQLERRMERQFMSEHAGHRTTLRLQITAQAVGYKASLDDPMSWKPFRMN